MFSPDQPLGLLEEADGEETEWEVVELLDVVVETEVDGVESPPLRMCQSMVTRYPSEEILNLPIFRDPVVLFAVPVVVATPRRQ